MKVSAKKSLDLWVSEEEGVKIALLQRFQQPLIVDVSKSPAVGFQSVRRSVRQKREDQRRNFGLGFKPGKQKARSLISICFSLLRGYNEGNVA